MAIFGASFHFLRDDRLAVSDLMLELPNHQFYLSNIKVFIIQVTYFLLIALQVRHFP